MRLTLGLSPCPNDTYIFYALINGLVKTGDIDFEYVIDDVETLNGLALEGWLEVSKVSCHAYFYLRDRYRFLNYGAAFGRGCGPLVVSREAIKPSELSGLRMAVPGRYTTAMLLMKLFTAQHGIVPAETVVMPFSQIMTAVQQGIVDTGLIIHEGRFTFQSYGLKEVIDLGSWWEDETGLPIPLGGIVAKTSLGEETIGTVEQLIRESIIYADADPVSAMPFIRQHAQELSEDVIRSHIGLYVNDYSRGLPFDGQRALEELIKRTEGAIGWIRP